MVTAYDDAPYGFNVHYDRYHNERQVNLIEYGAEEYHKDAKIAAHTESLANMLSHETVVFVRRIAHHKRPHNRQKSYKQY
jgi:hypothetical protein